LGFFGKNPLFQPLSIKQYSKPSFMFFSITTQKTSFSQARPDAKKKIISQYQKTRKMPTLFIYAKISGIFLINFPH